MPQKARSGAPAGAQASREPQVKRQKKAAAAVKAAAADEKTQALSKLSGDEQRHVFTQLCNVLDPGIAMDFSSVSATPTSCGC